MLAEQIDLTQLRTYVEHHTTRDRPGTAAIVVGVPRATVLALIDLAEAAHALTEKWASAPRRQTLDRNPYSLRGREAALHESLARFTFNA